MLLQAIILKQCFNITILIDMDNGRAVNECRVYGKCNSWYILNVISSISQKPCAWGWWWLFAPYKDKLSAPVHHLIIYFCQSKYSFVVFKVKTAFIRNLHELKVMVFLLVRVMVFNATFKKCYWLMKQEYQEKTIELT